MRSGSIMISTHYFSSGGYNSPSALDGLDLAFHLVKLLSKFPGWKPKCVVHSTNTSRAFHIVTMLTKAGLDVTKVQLRDLIPEVFPTGPSDNSSPYGTDEIP